MTIKNHIWNQIVTDLKKAVPSSHFHTWLSQATLTEITAHEAVIEVPSKTIADWLQDNCGAQLQMTLRANLNMSPGLRFIYGNAEKTEETIRKTINHGRHRQFDHGIDVQITFADFVLANSNRLAYSSALSVANSPATAYNPLYIYSSLSLGKTHILNGIGNWVLENTPAVNIQYLSADQCVGSFLNDRELEAGSRFWETEDSPDFILLDDIHQVAAQRHLQPQLLALCSSFLDSARQLVLASAYPPAKIRNVLPQLRSRLESGLIAEIEPPGQRTKVKIIKKMAEKAHLPLPEDVALFLANSTDDMQTLRQHILTLKARSCSDSSPVDITTAQSIVNMVSPSTAIDIHHIQDVTARYFSISTKDMLSTKREKTFSYPRQMAMYLCKKLTPSSLKEIGVAFGNKHHSTVIHAQRRIQQDKTGNQEVSNDIKKIQHLLL